MSLGPSFESIADENRDWIMRIITEKIPTLCYPP
jgi:hypothetical protein